MLIYGVAVALGSATTVVVLDLLADETIPPNVKIEKFYSQVLDQEREILVHLPHGYDPKNRYPVFYVLDGSSEDIHISNKFHTLTTAGYTPPTIIIGIPNMTRTNRQTQLVPPFMKIDHEKPESQTGDADNFLRFVESELIPFVEGKYSTSSYRALSGFSRSGLLVAYSLMYKPEMFQARFCYSAPFWRENNLLVSRLDNFLSGRDSLAGFFYMSCGENETPNIKTGTEALAMALGKHAPKGLTLYFEITPGADHQNNSRISASAAIRKWTEYVTRRYIIDTVDTPSN